MLELDMELLDEFKWVDAICRDMFTSQHGVSEYINRMEQTSPHMQCSIPSWDNDYRMLKRICWLRNQVAHTVAVTDCTVGDVEYLRNFHDRLLVQQDPLAILEKVKRKIKQPTYQRAVVVQKSVPRPYNSDDTKPSSRWVGLLCGALAALALILCIIFYFFK